MFDLDLKRIPKVNSAGINERVAQFNSRSIKGESKKQALQMALGMIDLTTLEGKDTEQKVRALCYKAIHPFDELKDLPSVAAVCVYATHVRTAKKVLENTQVKVAAVATAFPSGNASLRVKLEDTQFALDEGADEIDMVISRGEFLSGNYNFVFDEIAEIKSVCKSKCLKVILETGELGTLDNVRKAGEIAMHAGADFIKTSTGKIQPAATMSVSLVMLEAIKDFYFKTNKKIGMKPAGGISTSKQALQYLVMLNETLGSDWMSPNLFRFGASSLANDIVLQLAKIDRGFYYNKEYISTD